MLIFPAIDLKDGRVVRLYKGDFDTVHQVAEDPVETARQFYAAGARYLHMADLEEVFQLGVWRAVIGSAAVSDPDFVRAAVEAFTPEKIAVGIDARDGLVRTAGWVENAGLDYLAFARRMEGLGVKYIIFTDIDTDGTLSGPAFSRLEAMREAVGCSVTASGGVGSNADLRRLGEMGLYAAIVGKAWYAGQVDLAQAVREGGPQ